MHRAGSLRSATTYMGLQPPRMGFCGLPYQTAWSCARLTCPRCRGICAPTSRAGRPTTCCSSGSRASGRTPAHSPPVARTASSGTTSSSTSAPRVPSTSQATASSLAATRARTARHGLCPHDQRPGGTVRARLLLRLLLARLAALGSSALLGGRLGHRAAGRRLGCSSPPPPTPPTSTALDGAGAAV